MNGPPQSPDDGYERLGGQARIPGPRGAADDLDPGHAPRSMPPLPAMPLPAMPQAPMPPTPAELPPVAPPPPSHAVLKSLLGAWALAACSAEETQAVEDHLTECAPCAEEALRLRDAVGLLHPEENLDLKPLLRSRVLEDCLGKRPARIPVPVWASPYDTETARLDALLQDFGDSEWHTPVRLKWFEEERRRSQRTTVAGVRGPTHAGPPPLRPPTPLGGCPPTPGCGTAPGRRGRSPGAGKLGGGFGGREPAGRHQPKRGGGWSLKGARSSRRFAMAYGHP